jgi:hypothetical protein
MGYETRRYKTTKQLADELGISPAGVRYLIRTGSLEAEKVGRDWVIAEGTRPRYARRRPRKRGDEERGAGGKS